MENRKISKKEVETWKEVFLDGRYCLFYNGIFSTTKHTAQDYNNVVRSPL